MDLYFVIVYWRDYPACPSLADRYSSVEERLEQFGLKRFAAAVMYVLCKVFDLPRELCVVSPDYVLGNMLLEEILIAGNFGMFDERKGAPTKSGTLANLVRKTKRNLRFLRSFPDEVLWDVPFKVCHYLWRVCVNRKYKK